MTKVLEQHCSKMFLYNGDKRLSVDSVLVDIEKILQFSHENNLDSNEVGEILKNAIVKNSFDISSFFDADKANTELRRLVDSVSLSK